jgi:hypothetical protein
MSSTVAEVSFEELSQEEFDVLVLCPADDSGVDAETAARVTGWPKGMCALALDLLVDRGLVVRSPGSEHAHALGASYRRAW